MVECRRLASSGQGLNRKGNERLAELPSPLLLLKFEEAPGVIAHGYILNRNR
jgi:hypothetical protein